MLLDIVYLSLSECLLSTHVNYNNLQTGFLAKYIPLVFLATRVVCMRKLLSMCVCVCVCACVGMLCCVPVHV